MLKLDVFLSRINIKVRHLHCSLFISSPSLSILDPFWFILATLVFFYPRKPQPPSRFVEITCTSYLHAALFSRSEH